MKVARHPVTHKSITIPEYRKNFGPSHRGKIKLNRPAATCPACHQPLLVRGENDPIDRQTFAHFPVTKDRPEVFCPIKLAGKHKYSVLCPVDYDKAHAEQLRASFFANWKVHWKRFMRYVGFADIDDFIDVLAVANKANVWGYRAMREHEVIVALMLISDFKPVPASSSAPVKAQEALSVASEDGESTVCAPSPPEPWRKNWVRFWFESQARTFEDFWNLTHENKVIIRVEYAVPENKRKLEPDYLDSYKVVDVSFDYLANRRPGDDTVAPMVSKRMTKAFKKYL